MKKLTISVVSLLTVSVFAYSSFSGKVISAEDYAMVNDHSKMDHSAHMAMTAQVKDPIPADHCDMPGMSHLVAQVQDQQSQLPPLQPDGSRDTPSHRYSPGDGCSAAKPNARNKNRDGVNPNTVGCKCAKKCVNGQTQEDRSKDVKDVYICSNACNEKRCSCPDPCKS